MKIFYNLSAYVSHQVAGLDYIRCLKSLGYRVFCNYDLDHPEPSGWDEFREPPARLRPRDEQARDADEADLVILHEDPLLYSGILEYLPFLPDKRTICYVPWENERFAPAFADAMRLVRSRNGRKAGRGGGPDDGPEVWTCSEFSRRAIAGYFPGSSVLPHLVERRGIDRGDRDWYLDFLRQNSAGSAFVFLSVVDAMNPRKNIEGLMRAFVRLRAELGAGVVLLLKQYRKDLNLDFSSFAGVVNLNGCLSSGRMDALYSGCGAYVSAHHAEGWGLGLSSAMAYGKTAIATGYSGNLEFMNQANSLLVPYQMVNVSEQMFERIPLFTTDMLWAKPDEDALLMAMRKAALGRVDRNLPLNASAVTRNFGLKNIAARLKRLIEKES